MDEYLKEAIEIVKAQASISNMSVEEMTTMLCKLASSIKALNDGSELTEGVSDTANNATKIEPTKAIKEKSITCVVCGKTFKSLTKKHLAQHGLTPVQYREQCGYKKNTALVCKELQRVRRKKMQTMRLWERRRPLSEN